MEMISTRPRSPRFQRSRSGTPRLCHVSIPEAQPLSSTNLSRSKSSSKSRATPSALPRRPKENDNTTHVAPTQRVPSAWALSPGRAPQPKGAADGLKKKRSGGVMGIFRKSRNSESWAREEAVHELRMMGSRLLQWRFVNARKDAAIEKVRSSAEKKIFSAWLRIHELRNIVAAKRILIQRRKHKLKLARILSPQLHFLNLWEPLAQKHFESVALLSRVLDATCLPIPLIEGAQANLVSLYNYISISMDMMMEIEAAIKTFYSEAEEVSSLLTEVVKTVKLEAEGLEELMNESIAITSLEMHETSLRANVIQAIRKEVEQPPISTVGLQLAWRQFHQWHIEI